MKRFIESYDGRPFDVIVIGGGITGAAVAYDAASRGLSVALVEKKDFGCATSAATSKLIHGGFRYLANLELGLVRESLRERRTLENIAPNFVYPLPGIVVSYGRKFTDNLLAIRAGMMLYDLLAFDRNRTWDKTKRIPRHKIISAGEVLRLEPNVRAQGLKGGGIYHDCSSLSPERLTLAFIKSAVQAGAQVSNYAVVEGFCMSRENKICGVSVKDLVKEQEVEIQGKLTINCGGPWADIILGLIQNNNIEKKLRRSEGIHIVTKKLVGDHMVACTAGRSGHFFLIPWRDHTLIGTTDKEYSGDPNDFKVTRAAITELLENVNSAFGSEPLKYDDVLFAYGGLRPLVEDQTKGVYESSRKYEIYDNMNDGFDGLLTVEGGKYTTSRNLAEKVVEKVAFKLGRNLDRCRTGEKYLAGCEIKDMTEFLGRLPGENTGLAESTMEWLGRNYGTEYADVVEIACSKKSLSRPVNRDGEIFAQVVYALREEMAQTLEDIIFRRTGMGTLGNPGDEVLSSIADIAAAHSGWEETRKAKSVRSEVLASQPPGKDIFPSSNLAKSQETKESSVKNTKTAFFPRSKGKPEKGE